MSSPPSAEGLDSIGGCPELFSSFDSDVRLHQIVSPSGTSSITASATATRSI
ncbi:predicted protein [Arabidopsis lyrata subsp. lyrata]|uniref:Predicted protein n=1 Tax=Arabidopsis lyrata subsp. lyrata TaxID=81972 RepID=D7KLX4_ARALL|nr:predicted protein [Arabidopsis lyrata subsp. lyrata]